MSEESLTSKRCRRTYSRRFMAEMVAQCLQDDVSLAPLAVEHGMNPNVLHRWVKEHKQYGLDQKTQDMVGLFTCLEEGQKDLMLSTLGEMLKQVASTKNLRNNGVTRTGPNCRKDTHTVKKLN